MDAIRYWAVVIAWSAIKMAIPITRLKANMMDVLASLIAGLVITWLYGRASQSLDVGVNLITLLVWLGTTFGLRLIAGLVYLPVEIYREQGGFIENPFEIVPLNNNSSNPASSRATIVVTNRAKSAKVENCFVELISVLDLDVNQQIWPEPQKLYWNPREMEGLLHEKKMVDLIPDVPTWCDIADSVVKENRAYYLTWFGRGTQRNEIKPGKYELTIRVHGDYRGHPISHEYSLEFSFQPDNETKFRVENIALIEK